jgi:hypothetical protein
LNAIVLGASGSTSSSFIVNEYQGNTEITTSTRKNSSTFLALSRFGTFSTIETLLPNGKEFLILFLKEYLFSVALFSREMKDYFFDLFPGQQTFYIFFGSNSKTQISNQVSSTLPALDQLEIVEFNPNQPVTSNDACYVPGIRRWSSLHISIYILELIFYAFLMIITIIFYVLQVQPLYSRGLTPILGAFAQFLALLGEIYVFTLTVEEISKYNCLFNIIFYYGGSQLSIILIPFHVYFFLNLIE